MYLLSSSSPPLFSCTYGCGCSCSFSFSFSCSDCCGSCDCFGSLAVAWALSSFGGKLDIVDSYMLQFCNSMNDIIENHTSKKVYPDSYCHNLMKFLIKHFEWESLVDIYVKSVPSGISEMTKKYDFVFLDALAMDGFRIDDLNEIKKVLNDKFVIMMNLRGSPLSSELSEWAMQNFNKQWKNEFSDMAVIRND